MDLFQVQSYGRTEASSSLTNIPAGTMTLKLNSNNQNLDTDGSLSLDVTYLGSEGGNWDRTNVPITVFTQPH